MGEDGFQEDGNFETFTLGLMNLDMKMNEDATKSSIRNNAYTMNSIYHKSNVNNVSNFKMNTGINKYGNINGSRDANNNSNNINTSTNINLINGNNNNSSSAVDKRFKTLPSTEMLPRNEILGVIFLFATMILCRRISRGSCLIYNSCLALITLLRYVLESGIDS
ncbi:hypothetical protein KSP40_PGU005215 [Platanthera guangdongensis]|uniref:Uncharacterized protein n=1 Tax=Platanthera guangdongensis TaxID=2320717 RepID=A0ABR2MW99_9ASPA